MTKRTKNTDHLDLAAVMTAQVIAQAMRVRKLDLTGAVAFVAEQTGETVETVEGMLARAAQLAA